MKTYIYLTLLPFFLITTSCNDDFSNFSEPYLSYQIYSDSKSFLRLVNANGNGASVIQLFDKSGNLLQEEVLSTSHGLALTKCHNNKVEISYFISKSDVNNFRLWIKDDKSNPRKIGDYQLYYSFIINNGFWLSENKQIDKINLQANKTIIFSFLGKKLDEVALQNVLIDAHKFQVIDTQKSKVINYNFKNSILATSLLKKILSLN